MASEMMTEIINWLFEYKRKTNCKGVVLGISGGKDSTVVAMLAKKVWGDNVFGVMMPDGDQKDIADSIAVCSAIGIKSALVNIGQAVSDIICTINSSIPTIDVTPKSITNIAPRVRMTTLYAIAQSLGFRVIGTGNASESYIGWTTKWGDSAYDINPIYHLTCSEVIELGLELAKEFELPESLIIKKPSDGLTGKTDEENFGFSYHLLDRWILFGEIENSNTDAIALIERMHSISEHKREMPVVLRREVREENTGEMK